MRSVAARLMLLAIALSAGSSSAAPNAQVGRALGGKASSAYKPLTAEETRLRRPMKRRPSRALSEQAAFQLTTQDGLVENYLDPAHYKDVRDVSLDLMRQHPPQDSYYVAVGRSPVAIASFLAELNPNMVMTFPASDMRRTIQPAWKQLYFQHFEQLIPDDVINSNRTIVLFDRSRANSGKSLGLLKAYLAEFLRTKRSRARVAAVGLAPAGPLARGVEFVDTSQHPRTFLYVQGQYDHDEDVAPFLGKHRIGEHQLEQMQVNPNHATLRQALHDRMAQDPELDRTLNEEFSNLLEHDGESP